MPTFVEANSEAGLIVSTARIRFDSISRGDKLISKKKMLVFHSAYTFEDLRKRGLEVFVTARDAGRYFDSVLTVSPVASLQYTPDEGAKNLPPSFRILDERNQLMEGRMRRFKCLSKFTKLNFLVAQISLFYSLLRFGGLRDVKLVRAEDPRFNGLYGYIFSKILRKPFVVGVWGNPGRIRESTGKPMAPRLFSKPSGEARLEKFILARADMILAQNDENMSYVLNLGVERTKTSILPLGVGIDACHFIEPEDRVGGREELVALGIDVKHLIVCVSRLEEVKLVDYAVRACEVLKESNVDFGLLLIGDGRDREMLAGIAKKLGIGDRVFFAGNRSQEWISRLLTLADLAIAPLTGRALLEIALAGCPVAAFDVDWHKEIVQTGVTGELVRHLDSDELGAAMLRLIENVETRKSYGKAIRALALGMADPAKLAAKQLEIYRSLVEGA